ncbi:uracil-DNA glycosylase, partial [bacterium]|nr:uracil-DNA glycosylase [bacterium]
LTVRANEPLSHQGKGWEEFTDAILRVLGERSDPVVFVFWGAHAAKKKSLIDAKCHPVIKTPHPSPLSAYRGFFGSKVFSKTNEALARIGKPPVDWLRITNS